MKQILLRITAVITALTILGFASLSHTYALSKAQLNALSGGVDYFNTEDTFVKSCGPGGTQVSIATGSPTVEQVANAKIVIGIAKTDNVGKQGALIGLMVALAESSLLILANSNVPLSESNPNKQGDGSDHSSLGIFQQQITTDWSTISSDKNNAAAVNQLMDPTYNAEAFFGSPPGSKAPPALSKGLLNHSDWQSKEPWIAAQNVQASFDPTGQNYHKQLAAAQNLINKYYDSAPAIPLPVPFAAATNTNPTSSNIADSCSTGSTDFSGDQAALAKQILDNPNISYDYSRNGLVAQPFKDLADGKQADTSPNPQTTNVSVTLLKFILTAAKTHKVNISSFTTQHDPGDVHSSGYAVDINILDLMHLLGRDSGALDLIKIGIQTLPKGTGFGQDGCTGTPAILPEGYIQFKDACTHLHVQVPRGTQ